MDYSNLDLRLETNSLDLMKKDLIYEEELHSSPQPSIPQKSITDRIKAAVKEIFSKIREMAEPSSEKKHICKNPPIPTKSIEQQQPKMILPVEDAKGNEPTLSPRSLQGAIDQKYPELAKQLINLSSSKSKNNEAIWSAIKAKKFKQAKQLIGKDDPLLQAIQEENFDQAKELINKGTYLEAEDAQGRSPIFLAIEKQNSELLELYSNCFKLRFYNMKFLTEKTI
jgi:hypothetical protein